MASMVLTFTVTCEQLQNALLSLCTSSDLVKNKKVNFLIVYGTSRGGKSSGHLNSTWSWIQPVSVSGQAQLLLRRDFPDINLVEKTVRCILAL